MPKYTVPPASLTNLEWLKRIANESAEIARCMRALIDNQGNNSDTPSNDQAGA